MKAKVLHSNLSLYGVSTYVERRTAKYATEINEVVMDRITAVRNQIRYIDVTKQMTK